MTHKIIILSFLASSFVTLTHSSMADYCSSDCYNEYEDETLICKQDEEDAMRDYNEEMTDATMERLRSESQSSLDDRFRNMSSSNLSNSRELNRIATQTKRCKERANTDYRRCVSRC